MCEQEKANNFPSLGKKKLFLVASSNRHSECQNKRKGSAKTNGKPPKSSVNQKENNSAKFF